MKDLIIFDDNLKKEYNQKYILGIDEAGRGPLAGPVCVSGVVLKSNFIEENINDSKTITKLKREKLSDLIIKNSLYYKIVLISNTDIDKLGINEAIKQGVLEIINDLKNNYFDIYNKTFIALDKMQFKLDEYNFLYLDFKKGDKLSYSIASASIIAKVYRDNYMFQIDKKLNYKYDFTNNKGYGTKKHYQLIREYGISEYHRKTYKIAQNK